MSPACMNPSIEDALDAFMADPIGRAEDLWLMDGEIAFRRRAGTVETFDAELAYTGGRL
jgi:hypothetical protein